MSDNFNASMVSLDNLVADIQLTIGDAENKKHYTVILQKVLNAIRSLNVNISPFYKEEEADLNNDLRSIDYPMDCVKVISVGIYVHGEFFSFTRKPTMARTVTGDGEQYDEDFGENNDIPRRGYRFGARGYNVGYWVEDDMSRRLFVRNYEENKVILKYRSNGIDCTKQTCVPYQMKDLIMSMVIYELALNRIPYRHSSAELQLKMEERRRHYDDFVALEYEPQSMFEMLDAIYASYNTTVRRG